MRQSPRAHNVKHNKVTRVPRNFVYLDAEARITRQKNCERQTFRLAVAAYDGRRHDRNEWREREWGTFDDPASVWSWISDRCRKRARTVVVAHNLAYDLRITDAFRQLPALGWALKAIRLDGGQAWCIWRRDSATLVAVDSLSWIPLPLEQVGELVGIDKQPLPAQSDPYDLWVDRCRTDVEILATAWRALMDWIETEDLGNWKPTGAGQSWAAFRHRFMRHTLLVHEDDDARAAERYAAHTGRCEAWRHGDLGAGPYVEWDFECAYARIGAECDVPVKLAGELARPSYADIEKASRSRAVLVDCTVTTDVPALAERSGDGIRWPVGTFRTTTWDNELSLAVELGARVDVHRAWWYRRAPALAEFCSWVLGGLCDDGVADRLVVQAALKHWSRALIGRTAAQWSRWREYGIAPTDDVSLGVAFDASAGERFQLLQLGRQLIREEPRGENPDALVMVMSWVMAESRRRLWSVMARAGFDHVMYVDTDSVIVDRAGDENLAAAAVPHLRVKGIYDRLSVLGPRQIVLDGRLRAAGVPRGAVRVGRDTWEGAVWTSLPVSLQSGDLDAVTVARRRVNVVGVDRRRAHLPGGVTAPLRVG